ncbi:3-dehydroquinate synthase [Neobacillus piezotolerans]|uniref:3-dehydroquinate synthase n=1 Tax=Neobacillus piezotolerans TaxID=2259171 RepID=A0A3D8GQ98_9BACI|nr:3-dehydroquinate synthase [Neobacillus piezotolerans]RDU36349.1 3-dehydroquinate synthase [Neobacillus piezotolerans]
MESLEINTGSKKYPVMIGEHAVSLLGDYLGQLSFTKLLIITDKNVEKICLPILLGNLRSYHPCVFTAPAGEQAKSIDTYYEAMTSALENGLDRKSIIIALGGGAIGDLAGFVAATYMRGIRFIQVPTTILAHDSSVGGKTGINHRLAKNMIGAFHQPEAVFYDLSFLKSLPSEEVRSGFAEVVKHGLIGDPSFYRWLKSNIQDLGNISIGQYETMLAMGIGVKASIVAKDVMETGIRAFLNFGHTLGHAIEAEMGYGKVTHGEAVMIGMLFALEASKSEAGLEFDLESFRAWVEKLGFSASIPYGIEPVGLLKRMKQDKKAVGGTVKFVFLEEIGKPSLRDIDDSRLESLLNNFLLSKK